MSRCFPFPPPGYEKTNIKDEAAALTESIKRERDRADKERRKEKKREKKEKKKKEKKEKSKIKEEVEKKAQSHRDEGTNTDLNFIDHQKRKNYEIEQLERSGLSEEHGEPNSVPKVCDSSDSTQNSGKRKRQNSPFEPQTQSTMFRIRLPLGKHRDPEEQPSKEQLCSSSRSTKHEDQELLSGGKVCSSRGDKNRNLENQLFREQLPASARSANKDPKELPHTGKLCFLSSGSKPRDPEQFCREQPCSLSRSSRGLDEVVRREQLCSPPSETKHRNLAELPSKEHFCSSSGKIVTTEKKMADNVPGPRTGTLNHKMATIAPSSSIKQSCSIKRKAEVPPQDNSDYAATVVKLGLCGSGSLSDVQLRNLIDNWVPPPIQAQFTDFDDQEWLFDIQPRREPKRAKVIDVAACNERTSLWPRACYLPEAEIYALPYTVPF